MLRVSPMGSLPFGLAGLKGPQSFSLKNSRERNRETSVLQSFVSLFYCHILFSMHVYIQYGLASKDSGQNYPVGLSFSCCV